MKKHLENSFFIFFLRLLFFVIVVGGIIVYEKDHQVRRWMLATCGWSATARTWIDENGNQTWDQNELPFSGVKIFLDVIKYDPNGQAQKLKDGSPETVTDDNGTAEIFYLYMCGSIGGYEAYVTVPDGYKLTTPDRYVVGPSDGAVFPFGFIKK